MTFVCWVVVSGVLLLFASFLALIGCLFKLRVILFFGFIGWFPLLVCEVFG